uniref:N(6)-L-threonylcarbamoyladenine synthase n=1 Tax=Plectus sambesii TaxID=2011161 RepID=A0A914V919_9BILA
MIASTSRQRFAAVLLHAGRRKQLQNDHRRYLRVLGIETSCDDTAMAIIDDRRILAHVRRTKLDVTNRVGGVSPYVAAEHHRESIDGVLEECVNRANIRLADLDGIAVTRGPGTVICLKVGMDKALAMCQTYRQRLLPVDHMRSHALTVRFTDASVQYPFLCFLMSGGHCLLTLVKGPEDFLLLGQSVNATSPGEAADKVARHLRLASIPELASTCGGRSIEILAASAPPGGHLKYPMPRGIALQRNCDFDFGQLKSRYLTYLNVHGPVSESALPSFCASYQHSSFKHMATRLQRCIEILDDKRMVPDDRRTLVLSGGVASNSFIRKGLAFVAAKYGYRLVCPPPSLCTDNGVMTAWMGLELLEAKSPTIIERENVPDSLYVFDRVPIGEDISEQFAELRWKVKTKIDLDNIDAFMLPADLPQIRNKANL